MSGKRAYSDAGLQHVVNELKDKGYKDKLIWCGKGNWGEVYKAHHETTGIYRAVKVLLPEHCGKKEIADRFLGEAKKMISLNHNHIINIFDLGSPGGIPYYIMEYVDSENLRRFLQANKNLSRDDYLDILKQICDVLAYIHTNNIVHLDIKAENIMIDKNIKGKGIKLADFGLAHYLIGASSANYNLTADIPFIPPTLRNLRGKRIKRSDYNPSQDLAYFGEMLRDLAYNEIVEGIFSERQRDLLKKIIYDLREEHFLSAIDLSKQLRKLSPTHPPTGGIPEISAALAIDSNLTIRIPNRIIVPTTERILQLIRLPEFQRLRRVKQLGPTSLIYPGAIHSRFEHSLGAYSLAIDYLKHLIGDPEFDYLFNTEDLTALLVAVLLHDIGHYPFAHQLEELESKILPNHRDVTCGLICDKISIPRRYGQALKLPDVITKFFKVDPISVATIVKPTYSNRSDFDDKGKILTSFLDGALDVDKQDYLLRDSIHVGVEYALHLDRERLFRSLTISKKEPGLAVTEKGKVIVEFLIMSRSAMFSEVYWHHTNRAATAMIQRAFREVINSKKLKQSDLLPILLRSSDEEILNYLVRNGNKDVQDLIPNPTKWEIRQVYKRIVTFAAHYGAEKEEIYHALIKLDKSAVRDMERKIVSDLNRKHPAIKIKPHEILLDIPTGEERLSPVQIIYPNTPGRNELSLKETTHFNKSIFDQFFKFTKKARVFCHPKHKESLRKLQDEIRGIIAQKVNIPLKKSDRQ